MNRLYAMLVYIGVTLAFSIVIWLLWKFLFGASAATPEEYQFISIVCVSFWLLGMVGITAVCANTKEG